MDGLVPNTSCGFVSVFFEMEWWAMRDPTRMPFGEREIPWSNRISTIQPRATSTVWMRQQFIWSDFIGIGIAFSFLVTSFPFVFPQWFGVFGPLIWVGTCQLNEHLEPSSTTSRDINVCDCTLKCGLTKKCRGVLSLSAYVETALQLFNVCESWSALYSDKESSRVDEWVQRYVTTLPCIGLKCCTTRVEL